MFIISPLNDIREADTAPYPAVPDAAAVGNEELRMAYWEMLREYVDLKALHLPRDQPISILELRCGEALEAPTLCAYLGGCKDRFDLNGRVRYTGFHDDGNLLDLIRPDFEKLCRKKLPQPLNIFSFATCFPERRAPVNDVLVLNHFDKEEFPYSEWKSGLQLGLQYIRKNGIVIATANWTGHAPDLRHILSDKCHFLCDKKNKHAPLPDVYNHIIVAQKVKW